MIREADRSGLPVGTYLDCLFSFTAPSSYDSGHINRVAGWRMATISFAANPSNGDTINVGGTVFTFVATPSAPTDIQIGSSTAKTLVSALAVMWTVSFPAIWLAEMADVSSTSPTITYVAEGVPPPGWSVTASAATMTAADHYIVLGHPMPYALQASQVTSIARCYPLTGIRLEGIRCESTITGSGFLRGVYLAKITDVDVRDLSGDGLRSSLITGTLVHGGRMSGLRARCCGKTSTGAESNVELYRSTNVSIKKMDLVESGYFGFMLQSSHYCRISDVSVSRCNGRGFKIWHYCFNDMSCLTIADPIGYYNAISLQFASCFNNIRGIVAVGASTLAVGCNGEGNTDNVFDGVALAGNATFEVTFGNSDSRNVATGVRSTALFASIGTDSEQPHRSGGAWLLRGQQGRQQSNNRRGCNDGDCFCLV